MLDRGKPSLGNNAMTISMIIALAHMPILIALVAVRVIQSDVAAIVSTCALLVVFLINWKEISGRIANQTRLVTIGFVSLFLLLCAASISNTISAVGIRYALAGDMWRQFAMAWSPAILFFVLASTIKTRKINTLTLVVNSFAICIAALFFSHIFGLLPGFGYVSADGQVQRDFGVLGDTIAWPLGFLTVFYFARRNWLASVIFASSLLATASRAPFIVSAVCIAGLLLAVRISDVRELVVRLFAAAGGCVLAVLARDNIAPVIARLSSTRLMETDRFLTTQFTLRIFEKSPVWGSGFNSQQFYFRKMFGNSASGAGNVYSTPTSTPAQMLADFGVVGAAFFLIFVVCMIVASIQILRSDPPMASTDNGLTHRSMQAVAIWNLAFIVLNQAAAYVLPLSIAGLMFFGLGGMCLGYSGLISRKSPRRSGGSSNPRNLRYQPSPR